MLRLSKTSDGSIINEKGEYVFFSIDRFVEDICIGDRCFICGSSPQDVEFDNEHVLPNWMLREYNLHSRKITLPNLSEFRYDQYTIPCCRKCNSSMNEVFEKPIHRMINRGYEAVYDYLKKNGPLLFFNWMALIYIKTHLKDKQLRFFRDSREGNESISDLYAWEDLHHIHCIARSFYTNAKINRDAFGSFIVLRARAGLGFEDFDFGDIYLGRAVLLRMDEVCFFAILNDSGFSQSFLKDTLSRISGPLSPIQIREVLARLAFVNVFLEDRPKFWSEFDLETGHYWIGAGIPGASGLGDFTSHDYGQMLYSSIKGMLSRMVNTDRDLIIEQVKEGKYTFLFDQNGHFIGD